MDSTRFWVACCEAARLAVVVLEPGVLEGVAVHAALAVGPLEAGPRAHVEAGQGVLARLGVGPGPAHGDDLAVDAAHRLAGELRQVAEELGDLLTGLLRGQRLGRGRLGGARA
ncbi:hypothetical protein ACFSTC_21825 [Nonomuraea ferruginea]